MSDKPDRDCRAVEMTAERRRLLNLIVRNLFAGEGPILASRMPGEILREFPIEMMEFRRECIAQNMLNHALRLGLVYVYSVGCSVGGQDDVSFDATKAGHELKVWNLDPDFDGHAQPSGQGDCDGCDGPVVCLHCGCQHGACGEFQ